MRRVELKFLIPFAHYYSFRERLAFYATRDSHTQRNGKYPVFSSYYDTHDLEFYQDKVGGEYEHLKIRVRGYTNALEEASKLFLEAKVKHNRQQIKVRLPFHLQQEINESIRLAGHEDFEFFQQYCGRKHLAHACNVFYEREAFALKSGNEVIRVNFDTNVLYLHRSETRVDPCHYESRQLLDPGYAVLEIKHEHSELPAFLQTELHHLQASVTTFSKYANAIERLSTLTTFRGAS